MLSGPSPGVAYAVRHGSVVGRDVVADIAVLAPGVSRKHMQFALEAGEVWVQDLDSSNGTFVNGVRIRRFKLSEGDTITLGDVSFRFSLVEGTPPGERRPRPHASPPTERLDTERMRLLVGEDEVDSQEDYSFDASKTFTMDLQVQPKEQVAALRKRLQLLFEVSQALAVVKQRDELLGKILETLFEVFPQADRGAIVIGPSVDLLRPAIVRDRRAGSGPRAQISRTIARKVFEQKKALLSHDVGSDARFSSAVSLADLSITAFMVAPLLWRQEEVQGFIQLEGRRQFAPDDLNLLAGLAASATVFLKNLELFESVAREVKEREALHSELRIASRIQTQLLPKADPSLPWLELSGRMKTAKEVGGDYFDYVTGPRGELWVIIGDVSGKGVPAGLVMVMARSVLHSLLARSDATDPKTVAIELNRLLKKDIRPGMFMSLLLGLCDAQRHSVRFAGCGHERPLVFRAARGQVEPLELGGTVLGVVADNSRNVAEAEVVLAPGDQVLLYTDGVTEARDATGKMYGAVRLMQTFSDHGRQPPGELLRTIESDLTRHARGADQHDDITLIALRRR